MNSNELDHLNGAAALPNNSQVNKSSCEPPVTQCWTNSKAIPRNDNLTDRFGICLELEFPRIDNNWNCFPNNWYFKDVQSLFRCSFLSISPVPHVAFSPCRPHHTSSSWPFELCGHWGRQRPAQIGEKFSGLMPSFNIWLMSRSTVIWLIYY